MNAVDSGVDYASAPPNYAVLFRDYHAVIIGRVKQKGVPPEHVEDVASEILLKLYQRDILDLFDPGMVYLYGTDFKPARFRSFITRHVDLYIRGQYDKVCRRNRREGSPLFEDCEDDGAVVNGHEDDVLDRLETVEMISGLRAYLADVPRRSQYDTLDLVWLFDLINSQVQETGRFNAQELCREIGVSTTAFYTWRRWLARNVANYLGETTRENST